MIYSKQTMSDQSTGKLKVIERRMADAGRRYGVSKA